MFKRTIKDNEIVSDIRSGMTTCQLTDKYHVSPDKLQSIFCQLLDAHAIEQRELEPLLSVHHAISHIEKRRQLHGSYVFVRLPTYDLENLLNEGQIVDISETGFKVAGVETRVGENKEFLVQTDYISNAHPFTFKAQCQRASKAEDGKVFSGFKITSISDGALEQLRKLGSVLTLSE